MLLESSCRKSTTSKPFSLHEDENDYSLLMWDEVDVFEIWPIRADSVREALSHVEDECRDWVESKDWDAEYTTVQMAWVLNDPCGQMISRGTEIIEVNPNHASLVQAAGGDILCDHYWTANLGDNLRIAFLGGKSCFSSYCRNCGLIRKHHCNSSSRNPGEHDRMEYDQPASWCAGCQSVECVCNK